MDIIEIALKKSSGKFNFSFEYMDKLITDWHERNLKTPEQVNKHLENQKNIPVQSKNTENKKQTTNYPQRQYTDLNNFYSNI